VWAAHLLVIYGTHTIVCSQDVPGRAAAIVIGSATLVALVSLAVVSRIATVEVFGGGQSARFMRNTMMWLAGLSALAITWAGGTAFFLPACLALR
jgi:hypothetical protein